MHAKDVALVEANEPNRVPLRPTGCALGRGIVDIARALRLVGERSPHARGMHVAIEIAWVESSPGEDRRELMKDLFAESIAYLGDLVENKLQSEQGGEV
jgi:hypothetical protein